MLPNNLHSLLGFRIKSSGATQVGSNFRRQSEMSQLKRFSLVSADAFLGGKKQVFRGDRMASMFPSLRLLFHHEDQRFPLYPFVLLWCATMIYVFNAQWSDHSAHSAQRFWCAGRETNVRGIHSEVSWHFQLAACRSVRCACNACGQGTGSAEQVMCPAYTADRSRMTRRQYAGSQTPLI